MTVILVLLTFVTAITIDYFLNRNKKPVMQVAEATQRKDIAMITRDHKVVAGFKINESMRYHPGHTWALSESPNLVRVGIDDFAAKVIGATEGVSLPQRGQWIRQGQKIATFKHNGANVDLVSPIEGSVSDINEAVLQNSEMARKDPYGEGWLITVQSPDAKTNFRNLLSGALVRHWMEDAATRLASNFPKTAVTMADGGTAIDDLSETLDSQQYDKVVKEFFLL